MNLHNLFRLGVALAISLVFGCTTTSLLLPPSVSRRFTWTLAAGAGLAWSSLIFFLFRRPVVSVELAAALASLWILYRRNKWTDLLPPLDRVQAPVLILAVALGLVSIGLMIRVDRMMPHGDWDGWAIWNTHARLLLRDGPNWKNDVRYTFHGDYPLLTSATTARLWRYTGLEVPELGALLGLVLGLSGVALLTMTATHLQRRHAAILFALVLVSTPFYLYHSTSQYADVPLSFLILSTIALICLHGEAIDKTHKGTLVLAGFMAGCAGWTKNEGLLFMLAVSVVLLCSVIRTRGKALPDFLSWLSGLAVPLLVTIYFKLTTPASNDIIAYQNHSIDKILDLGRHAVILRNAGIQLINFGAWPISPWVFMLGFVAFRGVEWDILRQSSWCRAVATLGLMLSGYYVVYLVTPMELQVHLDSSMNRLLLHLWPSFLLLAALLCKKDTAQLPKGLSSTRIL
jgi:hypothetical protein